MKAAIFDMDGLLLDTERPAVDAWAQAAKELELDLPESVVIKTIGRDWEMTKAIVLDEMGNDCPFDKLQSLVQSIYRNQFVANGVQRKAGAEEILSMLREHGIPVGLATSTARKSAEWKLESAGLLQYLPCGACGDEVQRGKPYPDIYLLAARNLGVQPEQCAALEDSPAGLMAAKAAGMTTIMVPDLVEPTAETLVYTDYVVRDLNEAGTLLLGLFHNCSC